jgi:hypothetical protein
LHKNIRKRIKVKYASFRQPGRFETIKQRVPEIDVGVQELFDTQKFQHFLYHAARIPAEKLDVAKLNLILQDHFDECFEKGESLKKSNAIHKTYFAKLICLIDWIKYGLEKFQQML